MRICRVTEWWTRTGRFSGRHWVYPLADATVPARTSVVNIIVTPAQGVRLLTVPQEYGRIAFLASSPHAQLVEASHGVWWFKWHAIPLPGHRGWKSLTFSGNASAVPAWALRSSTGTAVLTGPVGQWHVASDGQSGYVAFGDYWRLPRGRYTATVRYSAESLANIEIWNSTGSFLLLRRQIPATTGPVALPVVFTNYRHFPAHVFHGWGPFKATLAVSPRHKWNNIEVRIWSPTGGTIDVYNISVVPKSG